MDEKWMMRWMKEWRGCNCCFGVEGRKGMKVDEKWIKWMSGVDVLFWDQGG